MTSCASNPLTLPSFCWNTSTSWMNPYSQLEERIKGISLGQLKPENTADLKEAFQIARSWTWQAGKMKDFLKDQLKPEIAEKFLEDILAGGSDHEITQYLEQLSTILKDEYLGDLTGLKTTEIAQNRFDNRALTKDFVLKDKLQNTLVALLKEGLIETKYFFYHVLDILTALTGVGSAGSGKGGRRNAPPSDDGMGAWEAQQKIDGYWKLLAAPAAIFAFISIYVPVPGVAIGLTALFIIATLVAVAVYQRYLMPCPKEYSGLKNMSIEILKTKDPVYLNRAILDEIEEAFAQKKGVLLVGEPGAGKSSMAHALAKWISDGNISFLPPSTPLFLSSASQYKSEYSTPSLGGISTTFEKHKQGVVFFFDEFHAFFKKQGQGMNSQSDTLKVFCNDFKYVVGATTTVEYTESIEGLTALEDRRFKVIKMKTLKDETIEIILTEHLNTLYPEIPVGKGAIAHIVKNAENFNSGTAKVDAAQSLLSLAIIQMQTVNSKKLQEKISALDDKITLLSSKAGSCSTEDDKGVNAKLKKKQEEIAKLKANLEERKEQAKRLEKLQAYHLKLKIKSYQMAENGIKLEDNPELKRKWLELNGAIKLAEGLIAKERKALKLPKALDIDLIDSIITKAEAKRENPIEE